MYFVENWKTKCYFSIIENAKKRGCGETNHHILPRSMGGNNKKENLVSLTHREHFIVHFLLTKMCKNTNHRYKMCSAFWRMNNSAHSKKQKNTSRMYEVARKLFSKSQKGRQNYNKGGYVWNDQQKENARGKRPHVNQTGENNNNFKGYYQTPWGLFSSISEAHNTRTKEWRNMPKTSLLGFCKSCEIPAKRKTKYLQKGEKPKDYGFMFIPKEKLTDG